MGNKLAHRCGLYRRVSFYPKPINRSPSTVLRSWDTPFHEIESHSSWRYSQPKVCVICSSRPIHESDRSVWPPLQRKRRSEDQPKSKCPSRASVESNRIAPSSGRENPLRRERRVKCSIVVSGRGCRQGWRPVERGRVRRFPRWLRGEQDLHRVAVEFAA